MKVAIILAACCYYSLALSNDISARAAAVDRPNFIIILADDQGYGDLGCFGHPKIKTPHIDRMAAEGTRFTSFYVPSPLCSPSRAALMTGCYPRRVGMANGVLRPDSDRGLHPDELLLPELLKKQGYATHAIGKWHLGFRRPFLPTSQGFDSYFGILHNLDHWETEHFADQGGLPLLRNGDVVERPADPAKLTEQYTEDALRFIRAHQHEPFFLYLAHTMPHNPIDASERFRGKSAFGLYGDVIECLDWSTGQILETLRELNLDRRTIVVYTSDNGPAGEKEIAYEQRGSAGPLRGQKHTVYEGGMREPCVMWGPGIVAAGQGCDELATSMDLLPTFVILAGGQVPVDRKIDGKNIAPLVRGEPEAKTPHDVFLYHNGGGVLQAIRAGDWKLHVRPKLALYNLKQDIGETTDLAEQHPDIVARLKELFVAADRELERGARPVGVATE